MCCFALKNCSREIYLEVARFKAGLQYSQQSQVNEVTTEHMAHVCATEITIVLIMQKLFFIFTCNIYCCNLTKVPCGCRNFLSSVLFRAKTLTVPH